MLRSDRRMQHQLAACVHTAEAHITACSSWPERCCATQQVQSVQRRQLTGGLGRLTALAFAEND